MFDKMKQFMEMKKQADAIKRELDGSIVESNEVKGITVKLNGSMEFQAIDIDAGYLTADNKRRLEADLLRGVNAAVKKSQSLAAQKMKSMLPPGFPGM